jgi:hypothetical protein
MPNWWLIWAEHLAKVLAEWWLRSGPTGREDQRADGDGDEGTPDGDDG